MSKFTRKLYRALLASSALAIPLPVFAQDQPPPQTQEDEQVTVERLEIRGAFIPDVMRETSEVSTVLLQEDLARQGDDNVGEALARTSGLSLVEGRFIYVRGLGERYSSALMNASPLPSPEPLQRVVPLDLFPSNILSGAVVQKSYSAEYPGEFGGGVINIETLRPSGRPFFTIGTSVGANTETTLRSGLTYYGSDSDPLGFDDGTREMPGLVQRAIREGRGRISDATFERDDLVRIGSSFLNAPLNLIQRNDDIPGNFKIEASGGTTFLAGPLDFGVIVVGGFNNSWRTRNAIQEEGFIGFDSNGDPVLTPETQYQVETTNNNVTVNGLFGITAGYGEHDLRWTNLWVHDTTKQARIRAGFDHLAGRDILDQDTGWYERELLSTQLAGNLEFGANLEIDWRAAFAQTTREAPYERTIRYAFVGDELLYAVNNANRTGFSFVKDDLGSGGIDLTYRLNLERGRVVFKGGAASSHNNRFASQRLFQFQSSGLPVEVQRQRVDYLLSDFNQAQGYFTLREITGASGSAAYRGDLDIDAFYLQGDFDVIPYVRISGGVRHEDATQSVELIDLFGGAPPASPAPLENDYWLPAATVTWNFREDFQLRVGASRTIARPQFRELAPQSYLDPESLRLYSGNPFLTDSELTNLDARVEWYFARNQFLAGGLFWKEIDRPVEAIVNEAGATLETTFINAPKAELFGAEIELRRYFESPDRYAWMNGLVWFVSGNYTYTRSELKVDAADEVFPLAGGGAPSPASVYFVDGAQLQGQSRHLANFQLGFEDEMRGLEATLLVSYGSERISARGRPGFPDLVVDPGLTLDLTARKAFQVGESEVEFGLEIRNILGTDFRETQTLPGSAPILVNVYDQGTSFSLSAKKRF